MTTTIRPRTEKDHRKYGRIKRGAKLMHDHGFYCWPECRDGIVDDPDMIFEVDFCGAWWDCKAKGFGVLRGEYGNGSILASGKDAVELVEKPAGIKHWERVPCE